jgi:phosphatidylethanolamine/phosphatidyl-N-methylethanolamine N-methyltransferase
MSQSDFALFMGQLMRRPHQVVALAPSSRFLCAEMVAELDPAGGPVIELGAGTGNITQAILDRGIAPGQLHSIEMNPEFCNRLRLRFPHLNVHQMSAGDVGDLPVENAQAVISGDDRDPHRDRQFSARSRCPPTSTGARRPSGRS